MAATFGDILSGNESFVTRSWTIAYPIKQLCCSAEAGAPLRNDMMTETARNEPRSADLSRRAFAASAAGLLLAPLIAPMSVLAETSDTPALTRSPQFEEAFAKLLGGATPVEGKITLELPEIAENGNFVPVTILVDSPMTAEDHVKSIHLLSTGNPVAPVATFKLSPLNATARVQSRMRLAKTQDIIALAELSNGTLAIATALVKVTIGGCAS